MPTRLVQPWPCQEEEAATVKGPRNAALTEVDRVDGGDLAAKRLHHKSSHGVAHIARKSDQSWITDLSMWNLPIDDLDPTKMHQISDSRRYKVRRKIQA